MVSTPARTVSPAPGFRDAARYGFAPQATGVENAAALQRAVDGGGTIVVSRPGTYDVAGTVYVGSHTTLVFGSGVFLRKTEEAGGFTHVLLNKGALTKTYDRCIRISGLHVVVNRVDVAMTEVYGLRGQIAFFYVKDLRIDGFRCLDLCRAQFAVHVCTFEDLIIDDVIIEGDKDGIHLGRGRRFTIRNGAFRTHDDAIALNAHDYATSNPELGWIENGVIENCHDLAQPGREPIGYFCRILAGAWLDWTPGMQVQQSDTVVSNGRLYRVQMNADGAIYTSHTPPSHAIGYEEVDGIRWGVVQNDVTYMAGVRHVTFRDIFLEKPRTSFSVHFDNCRYSRSYYPGAPVPMQEQIRLDSVRVRHGGNGPLIAIGTPVDVLTLNGCSLRNTPIRFHANGTMDDYLPTQILMTGCVFAHPGDMELVTNSVPRKAVHVRTVASTWTHAGFAPRVDAGPGILVPHSDLPGIGTA